MTPHLQSFPISYHITHGALGLVTKPSIIGFYSRFPRFSFVNSIILKTTAFYQCLMIHIFHTMEPLNASPYFVWCSTGPQSVPTPQETPAVLELWRRGAEAPAARGLNTPSAFCVMYSSSLDSTTYLGLHEICCSPFPSQTSCYVTSADTSAIPQHLAQQVLTNIGLMLELLFC